MWHTKYKNSCAIPVLRFLFIFDIIDTSSKSSYANTIDFASKKGTYQSEQNKYLCIVVNGILLPKE